MTSPNVACTFTEQAHQQGEPDVAAPSCDQSSQQEPNDWVAGRPGTQ